MGKYLLLPENFSMRSWTHLDGSMAPGTATIVPWLSIRILNCFPIPYTIVPPELPIVVRQCVPPTVISFGPG